MRKYSLEISPTARKRIKKLDAPVRNRITKWIEEHLTNCSNPRFQGRNLVDYPGANWRYRVGKYRIVVDIQDEKIVILVVDVDKRNDVYKK